MPIVNMEMLARVLQPPVSLNTISALARDYKNSGMPIVKTGKNGKPYEFELDAVADWWAQRNADRAAAKDDKLEQLDLWARQRYGEPAARGSDGKVLSPSERKTLADAVRAEDYNRRQRGELLVKADYEVALVNAVVETRIDLMQIPSEAQKRLGLAPDQVRQLEEIVRRRCDSLAEKLGAPAAAHDRREGVPAA